MTAADIIVLVLVAGYCARVVINRHRKLKDGPVCSCGGSCSGCTGCGAKGDIKNKKPSSQE